MHVTFAKAVEMFQTARRGVRKLVNNTYLEKLDEHTFAVRLHNTHIVKIHDDGTYTLNNGGWNTVTTKARMNEFSPARIGSERGAWMLWDGKGRYEYQNGMKVNEHGEPLNPAPFVAPKRPRKVKPKAQPAEVSLFA